MEEPTIAAPILEEDDDIVLVPGTKGRRVLAGLADFFLMSFASLMLFSLLQGFASQSSLAEAPAIEMEFLSQESKAAHLIEYKSDGHTKTDEEMIDTYARTLMNYDGAGEAKDIFSYYYCVYSSESKTAMSAMEFNTEILHAGETDSLFEVKDPNMPAPLKESTRGYLYALLMENNNSAECQNSYRDIAAFYQKTYEKAWSEFAQSEPYYSHLMHYTEVATQYFIVQALLAIDAYVVAAFIFYCIVPLIKRSNMTIGMRILKLQTLNTDGSDISVAKTFAVGGINILVASAAIPFTPLLIYGFDGVSMPFIVSGTTVVRLGVFLVISLILVAISLGFMFMNKENKSLIGFVTDTCVYTTDGSIIAAERERIRLQKERDNGGE